MSSLCVAATAEQHDNATREIRTAVRQGAIFGLGNVLAKILSFAMLPFYTHYLSPAEYGILEILDLSLTLLGMVLHMGLAPAMLKSYAGAVTPADKNRTISTAFLFAGVTGALTCLVGLTIVRPVSHALFGNDVPAKYLTISLLNFVLGYFASSTRTYLCALGASGKLVALDTIALFVMLGLNIFSIAVLKLGLVGILLSPLIVNVGWTALTVGVFFRVGVGFSRTLARRMLVFGSPLILSNLAVFALNFSDRFFLQRFESLEAVGVYAVGYKFGFMVNYLLIQPFYVMWQARMYVIYKLPDHRAVFGRIFTLYSLLLTWMALGIAILSPEIVRVMASPKFSASVEVIPLITLAYVFYGLAYYAQVGMFVTENTRLIGAVSAASTVVNLALNALLIPSFGMIGAAWATLLSFMFIAVATYWSSQRIFPLPLRLGRVGTAMLLAIFTYVGFRYWTPASPATLLALKLAALLVFPVVLWKLGMFSPAEVATLLPGSGRAGALIARISGMWPRRVPSL